MDQDQLILGAAAIAAIIGLLRFVRELGEILGWSVLRSDVYAKARKEDQEAEQKEHETTRNLVRDSMDNMEKRLSTLATKEDIAKVKGRLGTLEREHDIHPGESGYHEKVTP